ncbi:MAG: sulfatase-like hydrolase/transferase, partial [Planctomycetota bacterium]
MALHYNILFLLADQLRADFLGCYGAECIDTPNIDALARSGVRFNRCLTPSPLCVPARASMLTGRNAMRNGVLDNHSWVHPQRRDLGLTTWPEDLAAAGYRTAGIGKMHFYPWDLGEGFAQRRIAEDKRHIGLRDDYSDYLTAHGLKKLHGNEMPGYFEHKGAPVSPIPAEHQVDRWVGNETCDFLQRQGDARPFAAMVGFPGPHCPYDPPDTLANRYDPEVMPPPLPGTDASEAFRERFVEANRRPWNQVDYGELTEYQARRIRAHYAALVSQIDEAVGRIIATLHEQRLWDRTLVVFASDHGDFLGDFGMVGKGLFYESAVRVPLIVSGGATEALASLDADRELTSLIDLHPTFRNAAGLDASADGDGVSLFERCGPGQQIFGATMFGTMIAEARWKFARYGEGQTALYDLEADPT